MLAQPDAHAQPKEENLFKQAWHSVEEVLHLRSDVPPPVPPKDEKWLVKTVNKAVPEGQKPDPSFWDKLLHREEDKAKKSQQQQDEDDEEEWVSISVPADAALKQLGVQGDDKELQAKKNYFQRMAARVKEKFDEDDDDSSDDSSDDDDGVFNVEADKAQAAAAMRAAYANEKQRKQIKKLAPKVDPKEMKAAHKEIYHKDDDEDDDDEEDKKIFGSWWGCKPRRSKAEKQLVREHRQDSGKDSNSDKKKNSKRSSVQSTPVPEPAPVPERKWYQFGSAETAEEKEKKLKEKAAKERKATSKKHQAMAAAAAYEAMKVYQARKVKEGKEVSHGEMKAILAGMAMAEAVKLFEGRNDEDEDDDDKDETVAEAGSKVLKLFELMK